MADSFKRRLTDNDRVRSVQINAFTRTDTPPDLNAQLRTVGSRIRKSVTEGYITPPSSRVFAKAQSTTTIFASANDINRDVFASRPIPSFISGEPRRKRSLSPLEPSAEGDRDCVQEESHNQTSSEDPNARLIKPLRKVRGMAETRSLPVGTFSFSNKPLIPVATMAPPAEVEEEDWSVQIPNELVQSTFQPVVFD